MRVPRIVRRETKCFGKFSERQGKIIKTVQLGNVLKLQTHDHLPIHHETFGQRLHSHQTIQDEKEIEGLGIMSNGHYSVGPRSGFKRVGNEIADWICPETMFPFTAPLTVHIHIRNVFAHVRKLLDAHQIRDVIVRIFATLSVLRRFEIVKYIQNSIGTGNSV
jgi:hypothetical protein